MLLDPARFQRVEHRRKARGETPDLVVAIVLADIGREVACLGDFGSDGRETPERCGHTRGDEPPEPGGGERHRRRDDHEPADQHRPQGFGLTGRASHLDHTPLRDRLRQHPVRLAVDRDVVEADDGVRRPARSEVSELGGSCGFRQGAAARELHAAGTGDLDDRVVVGDGEAVVDAARSSGAPATGVGLTQAPIDEEVTHRLCGFCGASFQEAVGRRVQLPCGAAERERADEPAGDECHQTEQDRESRPEAHWRTGGRTTYPMPRTVCSTRGSPPSSSLRRR